MQISWKTHILHSFRASHYKILKHVFIVFGRNLFSNNVRATIAAETKNGDYFWRFCFDLSWRLNNNNAVKKKHLNHHWGFTKSKGLTKEDLTTTITHPHPLPAPISLFKCKNIHNIFDQFKINLYNLQDWKYLIRFLNSRFMAPVLYTALGCTISFDFECILSLYFHQSQTI